MVNKIDLNIYFFSSPLPLTTVTPSVPSAATSQVTAIVEDEDSGLSAEEIRERDLWIVNDAVRNR